MTKFHSKVLATALIATVGPAFAADGDVKRGAELYRACVACHSLEPGVHLTGPSLAGLWGRDAGKVEGFIRYSGALRSAAFPWNADTLNAWLADPSAMLPGTYMVFRGIENDQARADLIAFLKVAMAPEGGKAVLSQKLAPPAYVRGQQAAPLADAPSGAQVTVIRHCEDSYFVTTADGTETPYWEMNVRLKIDTRRTGPRPGKPVVVGAGMLGDRVSIIFSSIDDLTRWVEERC